MSIWTSHNGRPFVAHRISKDDASASLWRHFGIRFSGMGSWFMLHSYWVTEFRISQRMQGLFSFFKPILLWLKDIFLHILSRFFFVYIRNILLVCSKRTISYLSNLAKTFQAQHSYFHSLLIPNRNRKTVTFSSGQCETTTIWSTAQIIVLHFHKAA